MHRPPLPFESQKAFSPQKLFPSSAVQFLPVVLMTIEVVARDSVEGSKVEKRKKKVIINTNGKLCSDFMVKEDV